MNIIVLEVVVILLLIGLNGVFAMTEIALVSARRTRLERLAAHGNRYAAVALDLVNHPDRFLSTVQIGITLVGILAGAFGGATIAEQIDRRIEDFAPALDPYSEVIGLGSVVLGITYLSLILGELVPKRIALNAPERVSVATAPMMRTLSRLATPAVWFLSKSTRLVLMVLRVRETDEPAVTEEDLRALLRKGAAAGTIPKGEQEVVERVFRLGDRPVEAIMTPRAEIEWLDLRQPLEKLRQQVLASSHTRFPVAEEQLDHVSGILQAKDLWSITVNDSERVRSRLVQPLYIPANLPAFRLLELFRETKIHVAIVLDEYGSLRGLVTPSDILEALVGALPQPGEEPEMAVVRMDDGSFLVDAALGMDDVKGLLGVAEVEGEKGEGYQSLAGYLIEQIRRIPRVGDVVEKSGFRFEIVDMDGKRVDRIRIRPVG